jgi:hypothetical protein
MKTAAIVNLVVLVRVALVVEVSCLFVFCGWVLRVFLIKSSTEKKDDQFQKLLQKSVKERRIQAVEKFCDPPKPPYPHYR